MSNPTNLSSKEVEPASNVHALTVLVCQDCIDLKGVMCNNPQCVFCRRTMVEVQRYLDVMLLCPIVDGERLILVGDAVTNEDTRISADSAGAMADEISRPSLSDAIATVERLYDEWWDIDRRRWLNIVLDRLRSLSLGDVAPAVPTDEAAGWLPIESAPKDGTRILVWVPESENVLSVYWDERFIFHFDEEKAAKSADYQGEYQGAWTDDAVKSWAQEEKESYMPSHWRPALTPPVTNP